MRYRFVAGMASILIGVCGTAGAATMGFVDNPTTNSTDWATEVANQGGTVNSNVNFESHPFLALQPNFFAGEGVTLTPVGDVNMVRAGPGPVQGSLSPPLSPGEGASTSTRHLRDEGGISSLTVDFDQAVVGAGLFITDYYNPGGGNPLTVEAFDGMGGGGNSLGLFASVGLNFQTNNIYFMGISSDMADIKSLVFTDVNTVYGDTTGITQILFATSGDDPMKPVPLPPALPLMAAGMLGLGFLRGRRG